MSTIRPYQFTSSFMLIGPEDFQAGLVGRLNNANNNHVISGCNGN